MYVLYCLMVYHQLNPTNQNSGFHRCECIFFIRKIVFSMWSTLYLIDENSSEVPLYYITYEKLMKIIEY